MNDIMAKLVCKFEVEFIINEENREQFDVVKLNGFQGMRDGIIEMLQSQSDGKVGILEFNINE